MDSEFNLKIIDFGFTASIFEQRKTEGTEPYFSFAQHLNKPTNFMKDDIFTLGILLYMMVTAQPPFNEATKSEKHYKPLYLGLQATFWQKAKEENGIPDLSPEL